MIGVVGLSHLGLNYGLATAAKGFDVICYDPDAALVSRLQNAQFPIEEPGFLDLFEQNRPRLRYTSDPAELKACDLVFFALDVRTNESNESDLGPLTALINETVPVLSRQTTAVVMSQVRPGYMRSLVGNAKSEGPTWYYQVETLIFGAAVQRAMEPERIIVGAADPALPVPKPYQAWLSAFACPVLTMRYESAELSKLAINLYLVSTVSTTNTLAELCESMGADWGEIAPALRLDRRIGQHAYLKPGLGIGGGNLERDLVTIKGLSREFGTEAGIVDAWQRNSAHAKSWALRVLERELLASKPMARLAVWGLAYKQDTHSIKNSASIELIRTLSGCEIRAYDPAAKVETAYLPNLKVCDTAMETLAEADALVVMTPWKEFSAADPLGIRDEMKGNLVLDPYGCLNPILCVTANLRHFRIGSG